MPAEPKGVPLLRLDDVQELQRAIIAFANSTLDHPSAGLGYFSALDILQPFSLCIEQGDSTPVVDVFPVEGPRAHILESLTVDQNDATGAPAILGTEEIPWLETMHASALELLESYSSDMPHLVSRLVGCCLISRSRDFRSASFPFALGAIWLSPDRSWMTVDYAESLLHETTHQALYLDDMVNSLFSATPEVLDEPENRVVSAVRGVERRYDRAFHAASVATVLGHFHENFGHSDEAARYWTPLPTALQALEARKGVLADRGKALLREMTEYVPAEKIGPI